MADIRLLERTLQPNVARNRARINFAAKFLVALIQVSSVNLAEVASVFAGAPQRVALQAHPALPALLRAALGGRRRFRPAAAGVPRPVAADARPHRLVLGRTPLNILVLGVCHQGTAFPLLWASCRRRAAPRRPSASHSWRSSGGSSASRRSLICAPTASLSARLVPLPAAQRGRLPHPHPR